jgi:hypothetical protein
MFFRFLDSTIARSILFRPKTRSASSALCAAHYAAYRIMPRRLWLDAFQPCEAVRIDGGALAVGGIIRDLQGMRGGSPLAGNGADRREVVQFEPVLAPSSPDRRQDTFA